MRPPPEGVALGCKPAGPSGRQRPASPLRVRTRLTQAALPGPHLPGLELDPYGQFLAVALDGDLDPVAGLVLGKEAHPPLDALDGLAVPLDEAVADLDAGVGRGRAGVDLADADAGLVFGVAGGG